MLQSKIVIEIMLLVILGSMIATNCASMTGLGIGAGIDSHKPDSLYLPGWKAEAIWPGTPVKLLLSDGSWVEGKYLRLEQVTQADYAKRYADFRQQKQETAFLPALGDTITIMRKTGLYTEGEFLGFDHQPLAPMLRQRKVSEIETPGVQILVKHMGANTTGMVFLMHVDRITDARGNTIEGEVLRGFQSEGQIPIMSAIALRDLTGTTLIPVDQVHEIRAPNRKRAKWWGLGIGAVIDATVWTIGLAIHLSGGFGGM
jgi:hypothetical protein